MLSTRKIVAFVGTQNAKRAKHFFSSTLGLHLISEDQFAIVFDAGGTMLRVAIVPDVRPAGYTVLGWMVPDISRAVRGLVRKGVVFRRYPGMEQDEQGVWTAPGGARVAWFADADGNTLSLTEVTAQPRRRRPGKRTPLPKSGKRPARLV
jgi:catechol 2,3-dioxygenase-like lactoylglutathione lyase family enzyme